MNKTFVKMSSCGLHYKFWDSVGKSLIGFYSNEVERLFWLINPLIGSLKVTENVKCH